MNPKEEKIAHINLDCAPGIKVGDCTLKIIMSLDKMQNMRQSWNNLLTESNSNTIFLTWEWLYAWSRCFLNTKRKLFILCIYQSEHLIGIAPFYVEKKRNTFFRLHEIHFLGSPETGSDYLDVICQKGREKVVAYAIYDFLFDGSYSRSRWDRVCLSDIPSESRFLMHFMDRVERDGKYSEINRCAVLPQMELPKDIDGFFSMLTSNRRERLRRDVRRFYKEVEAKHVCFRMTDINQGLDRFFSLYNAKTEYDGSYFSRFFEQFIKLKSTENFIQIDFLSVNDKDVTGLLHLRYGEKLLMLLMAVDKEFTPKISLGNLLVGICIQGAIQDGVRTYDFLKGHEEYKFHWGNNIRATINLNINQHNVKAVLSEMLTLIKCAVKIIVR